LPILATLMMKATRSSETSVLTRDMRRHFPEDGIHQITALKTPSLTDITLV
jgi:hypothetical protein